MNLKTLAVGLGLATAVSGGIVSCTQKDETPKDKIEYVLQDIVNNKGLDADKFTTTGQASNKMDNLIKETKEGHVSSKKDYQKMYDEMTKTLLDKNVVDRHGKLVSPTEATFIDAKDDFEDFANKNPQLAAIMLLGGLMGTSVVAAETAHKVHDCISKKKAKEA